MKTSRNFPTMLLIPVLILLAIVAYFLVFNRVSLNTYTDTILNASIGVPAGWAINQTSDGTLFLVQNSPSNSSISLGFTQTNETFQQLESDVNSTYGGFNTTVSSNSTTIDGTQAYEYTYLSVEGNITLKIEACYIQSKTGYYQIIYSSLSDSFDQNLFNRVLTSFKAS